MSNIGTKFILDNRFTFDPNNNSLVDQAGEDETIRLGSNESRILLLLAERPNEVVSRNELHEFVWREQGFEVDDSSLTQAISTLRKMLKDSTKSPVFVKTVPKRGYQLICSVERTTPLLACDTPQDEVAAGVDETDMASQFQLERPSHTSAATSPTPTSPPPTPQASKMSWPVGAMLLVAILIPLIVVLFTRPSDSKFVRLETVNNIPVLTLASHPPIDKWIPTIKQCVKQYTQTHADGSPTFKVIATGGQDNQLVLNYIHAVSHSDENVTVRIFASQKDLSNVCRSAGEQQ
ncbi:transcriptional regulator [Vibrio sp. S4M6]|uniref:transcriptional regulator n=1 Tax=Vibrio sinus TaxID=2946865 RepID=UPI00202A19B5|nr:transcriptional regulator [Vibrio sinus]MCL9782847.1 transcriptional regulator [Vibrio sinus]